MRKLRITYCPFPQSDAESSDIVMHAADTATVTEIEEEFERRFPAYDFVSAQEEP